MIPSKSPECTLPLFRQWLVLTLYLKSVDILDSIILWLFANFHCALYVTELPQNWNAFCAIRSKHQRGDIKISYGTPDHSPAVAWNLFPTVATLVPHLFDVESFLQQLCGFEAKDGLPPCSSHTFIIASVMTSFDQQWKLSRHSPIGYLAPGSRKQHITFRFGCHSCLLH